MDRRQYLGLTGTSIVALLGGCSSSDGGGNPGNDSTETATSTPFRNESGTPTNVGTPTPKITTTATATRTPTPEPGPLERLLERKARDTGLSTKAVRWILEEETHDEPYGLSEDQAQRILDADPGRQFEVAVSMLNPSKYDAGLQVDDSGFDLPTKELTDEVAKDLRTIFQYDLQLDEDGEPVHYNNVFPQSRVFIYRSVPSYSIIGANEGKLSMAHPVDKMLNEKRVGDSSEIHNYANGETADLDYEESMIGQTWVTTKRNNEIGISPTYDLSLWESASIQHENASPAGIRGLNEAFGNNMPMIDQGERNNLLLQMTENGNKVLSYLGKPEMTNGFATVRDSLPYVSLGDAIKEQTEYDPFSKEGIPEDVGFKVGSSNNHEEYEIEVHPVDDIDFDRRPESLS